ncbi:MAG TPA: hypothetical protein IGR15_13260 [Synechococcus sp. M44_DOE_062]|nr:hypothetical protein [Synechococcus sp. M44_DOE_062]
MDGIGEFEFRVQILGRCMGSALGLGRPTRIQIHYSSSNSQNATEDKEGRSGSRLGDQIPSLNAEGERGSQGQALACVA